MIGSEIYDLFKTMTDGEEFASDTDAVAVLNMADAAIRGERNWERLKKTAALALGSSSLSAITDFDRPLKLWAVVGTKVADKVELKQAPYDDRFNTDYDWYYDAAANTINFIKDVIPSNWLSYLLDYKYIPAALDLAATPWMHPDYHALYAYEMVRVFKRADADFDFYKGYGTEYEIVHAQAIDWNESLAGR